MKTSFVVGCILGMFILLCVDASLMVVKGSSNGFKELLSRLQTRQSEVAVFTKVSEHNNQAAYGLVSEIGDDFICIEERSYYTDKPNGSSTCIKLDDISRISLLGGNDAR